MLDTSQLVKDVGTLLEGEEAVKEGLIDEVGGIREGTDEASSDDRDKQRKIRREIVETYRKKSA